MAELSNIAAELSKGKNVENNLSRYAVGMNSLYGRIGYIELALNLYTFSEVYGEDGGYNSLVENYVIRLADIIRKVIISDAPSSKDIEGALEAMDELRNELVGCMDVLTSYADRFSVFEYVLNRIEYNYKDCDVNIDYYDDKFEKDIINFITSDRDNTVINMKIGQVIGQLPMRLSKNKFFELLHDAFTIYKGSDVNAVEDFVYMLRSVSMLHIPQKMDTAFLELSDYLKKLESFSYCNMSEEEYDKAAESLSEASDYVVSVTDIYVLFMDTLNNAYTVLLSLNNAILDSSEKEHCFKIISEALDAVEGRSLPAEESIDSLSAIEGIQEKLTMQLTAESYALDDVRNSYLDIAEKLGIRDTYDRLFRMELLNSGSSFMKLDIDKAEIVNANEEYINHKCDELTNELTESFKVHERAFNRAIMAGILSNLPVFFNNLEEFKKYVHVALGQCSDEAEKKSCMKLMLDIMNDYT